MINWDCVYSVFSRNWVKEMQTKIISFQKAIRFWAVFKIFFLQKICDGVLWENCSFICFRPGLVCLCLCARAGQRSTHQHVRLYETDYEPLMMCTCVWLLGCLRIVWCRRLHELFWPKSVWMFDWLHCSIWTRPCMTRPRLLLTNRLCVCGCVYGDALVLFSFLCLYFCVREEEKRPGLFLKRNNSWKRKKKKEEKECESFDLKLQRAAHDWWGVVLMQT